METNVSGRGIRVVRMDGIYGCRNSLEFPVASLVYNFFVSSFTMFLVGFYNIYACLITKSTLSAVAIQRLIDNCGSHSKNLLTFRI